MELHKFLYIFYKHFLKNCIKETICIENWEGKDYDNRYIEYIKAYTKFRNDLLDKDEETVINDFKRTEKDLLDKYFKKMKSNFINNLLNFISLSPEKENKIINELDTKMDYNNIYGYIEKIRELEDQYIK